MPRRLSLLMAAAMTSQATAERPLLLLTLDHASFAVPRRFVADFQPWTSRGLGFDVFPFDVQFGDEQEDQTPAPQIFFDAVSRANVDWALGLEVAPSVLVEVVTLSDPDTVQWTLPPVFELHEVQWNDPITLLGILGLPDLSQQKHLRVGYTGDFYQALGRAQ